MTITIEATYENGTLRLDGPLPFKEHERVRVSVQPAVIRDHAAFLGSYAPEDEGLYDAYPTR